MTGGACLHAGLLSLQVKRKSHLAEETEESRVAQHRVAAMKHWIKLKMESGIAAGAKLLLAFLVLTGMGLAQRDLTELSLEDLMNTKVTSVSKKEQPLSKAAAAIFVITQEDIRRSGATNIPDLLRMVPGLDVAQINANSWAISARGFNHQYSDKLLVMIDGRTVMEVPGEARSAEEIVLLWEYLGKRLKREHGTMLPSSLLSAAPKEDSGLRAADPSGPAE